jgi:glucan phosphoethanolaminetransferase (alkaline phosphatase superfamily)
MEILNTYTETIELVNILGTIVFLIIGVCFIMAILNFICKEWIDGLKLLGVCVLTFILLLGVVYIGMKTETTYHECRIIDYNKVDLNKYEIVEHRDKIIVLKEID